jgi:hypothetical protein
LKYDLSQRELRLIELWWLSCEDMKIPEGTCTACEFKEECEMIRQKFYGKKLNNNTAKPAELIAQMNGC